MKHDMKLLESPFNKIVSGEKDVEFRLYDEKRKQIKIGDTIVFSKLPDLCDKIEVEVSDLYHYQTFRELLSFLGYEEEILEDKLNGIYKIYTKEQEQENGVLGIKIKKI